MQIDLDEADLICGVELVTNARLVYRNRGLCAVVAFDAQSGCLRHILCKTRSGLVGDDEVIDILNSGSMFSDVSAMVEDLREIAALCRHSDSEASRRTKPGEECNVI